MKKVLQFVLLFFLSQSFSQKKYSFDYALQYEETIIKGNKVNSNFFLVNSKQNSYVLLFKEKDTTDYNLTFIDQNGVFVNAKMNKRDFYNAETISNNCEQTLKYISLGKDKTADYYFFNLKDTIIRDTVHYHYVLKCNKSVKYQKRKKIVSAHFIVDKSSPEFAPFLLQSIMYEEWKINKIIPNGCPKLIYFINYDGTTYSKLRLVKAVKIDKYITIPNECDYTREEIRNLAPPATQRVHF